MQNSIMVWRGGCKTITIMNITKMRKNTYAETYFDITHAVGCSNNIKTIVPCGEDLKEVIGCC